MFGATQAAKNWAGRERKKGRAVGRKEGIGIGRAEERKELLAKFRARANGNADLHRIIEEVENEGDDRLG